MDVDLTRKLTGHCASEWTRLSTFAGPVGVDTHKHTHTAVAIDAATAVEQLSWTASATPAGYADLRGFVSCLGSTRWCWAIEGCGS